MFSVIENESSRSTHILITGGAGFIGTNLAAHLLATTNARITLFDNLSHPGAELNLAWLRSQSRAGRCRFIRGDVRSAIRVIEAMHDVDEVYHLASRCQGHGQSRADYEVNVTGTLNVLEAARCSGRKPMLFYVSSSKVYGNLENLPVVRQGQRFVLAHPGFRGISERMPVNFESPYVSTHGAGDRYVLDYARFYNLPTVVLRPDTVAGPRQFENEGHGWVAHLVYSVLAGYPVTVPGDGYQVREVLHVSDLVDALVAARDFREVTAGNAYNLGAGPNHCVSWNEMIELIEHVCYRPARVHHVPARAGERNFYMADSSIFCGDTGWHVRRSLEQAVRDIAAFWHANQTHVMDAPPLAWPMNLPYAA
jgi:CDP-paratose 2-epimerase